MTRGAAAFGDWSAVPRPHWLLWLLMAVILGGLTFLQSGPPPPRAREGANDFLAFYVGSRLAGTPALYDPHAVQREQNELGMRSERLPFLRLPLYATVLAPLSSLGYRQAYWLWQCLNLAAVAVFVFAFPGTPVWLTALTCFASYPLVMAFWNGQDVAFLLAALALALRSLKLDRPFLAGLFLSLCLIKFHLFFPLPLLLWRRGMARVFAGLAAGTALIVLLCFAVQGPGWVGALWDVLRQPAINPNQHLMPNLNGLFYTLQYGLFAELALSAGVLALLWRVAVTLPHEVAWAATLTAGLLVSHHAYVADTALLLPAALLVLASAGSFLRGLCGLVLLPPLTIVLMYPVVLSAAAKIAILAFYLALALPYYFSKRSHFLPIER